MRTETKLEHHGGFATWGDQDVDELREQFVHTFHRTPDDRDLRRFSASRAGLLLRLPMRGRRTVAGMIACI